MNSRLEANKMRLAAAKAKNDQKQVANSSSEGLSPMRRALSEISTVEGMVPAFINIEVSHIDRLFNPRDIPCSLDEVRAVQWPGLDVEIDAVPQLQIDALNRSQQAWWIENPERQAEVIDFFVEIHRLAVMLLEGQIHNIVVNRIRPMDNRFILLAGERRVIAALYSRGRIPILMAKVYTGLTSLQCRKITDQENTSEVLKTYEIINSKIAIWEELGEGREALELKVLVTIWHVPMATASILKRLFVHPEREVFLSTIRRERLGWREVEALVKGRVTVSSGETELRSPSVSTVETGHQTNPEIPIHDDTLAAQNAVSTVETNTSIPLKDVTAQLPIPVSTVDTGEGTPTQRRSIRAQLRESTDAESTAAQFGLSIKRKTNLSVVKGILVVLRESEQLPKVLRKSLMKLDLDSRDDVITAWNQLAQVFGDRHK